MRFRRMQVLLGGGAALVLFLSGVGAATVATQFAGAETAAAAAAHVGAGNAEAMPSIMSGEQLAFDEMVALCTEHMASMTSMMQGMQGTMGQGTR